METYTFLKGDKTINDVPLKSLTFQTGQTKWDGGSSRKKLEIYIIFLDWKKKKKCSFLRKLSSTLQRWWYLCSWFLILSPHLLRLLGLGLGLNLHDMKPTLVANKAQFLQNQGTLPISSPNPCTYIPEPGKGHCHQWANGAFLLCLTCKFHHLPAFRTVVLGYKNVLAKSAERGRKFTMSLVSHPCMG